MTKIEKFRELKSPQDIEDILMTRTCPGDHLNCFDNCPSCEFDPEGCIKCWNEPYKERRKDKNGN